MQIHMIHTVNDVHRDTVLLQVRAKIFLIATVLSGDCFFNKIRLLNVSRTVALKADSFYKAFVNYTSPNSQDKSIELLTLLVIIDKN